MNESASAAQVLYQILAYLRLESYEIVDYDLPTIFASAFTHTPHAP